MQVDKCVVRVPVSRNPVLPVSDANRFVNIVIAGILARVLLRAALGPGGRREGKRRNHQQQTKRFNARTSTHMFAPNQERVAIPDSSCREMPVPICSIKTSHVQPTEEDRY